MKPILPTLLLAAAGALVHLPAQADDAALLRCADVAQAGARLACYDALAAQVRAKATGAVASGTTAGAVTGGPAAGAAARNVPATQATTGAATAAAAAAATSSAQAATPQDRAVADFGLPPTSEAAVLQQIQSRLVGRFDGWRGNVRLELANGQVWQVVDGSRYTVGGSIDAPRVTIRRGVLGAMYMDIEGVGVSPRVRRLK